MSTDSAPQHVWSISRHNFAFHQAITISSGAAAVNIFSRAQQQQQLRRQPGVWLFPYIYDDGQAHNRLTLAHNRCHTIHIKAHPSCGKNRKIWRLRYTFGNQKLCVLKLVFFSRRKFCCDFLCGILIGCILLLVKNEFWRVQGEWLFSEMLVWKWLCVLPCLSVSTNIYIHAEDSGSVVTKLIGDGMSSIW